MSDSEKITAVLNAHQKERGHRDLRVHCTCGWSSGELPTYLQYSTHVAAALEPVIQEREKAAVNAHATATANSYMGEWPYMRQRWGTDAESEAARGIAFRTMRWLTELAARANQ